MCGGFDCRALNHITKRNNAPLPRCDEMFYQLGKARFSSKLDLKTDLHQIGLPPSDMEKTVPNSKYGQFEGFFMPTGLFQSLMNGVFYDCSDRLVVVYIDENHIHGNT